MKKIVLLLVVATLGCAQALAQNKTVLEYSDAQARVGDGAAEIHIKPTVAEVRMVDTKGISLADSVAERAVTTKHLDPDEIAGLGGDLANIRAWVAFLVEQDWNCDIIMNPVFMIKGNSTGGADVTVVGYPGKFDKWHPATDKDFDWLINERLWRKGERETIAPVEK